MSGYGGHNGSVFKLLKTAGYDPDCVKTLADQLLCSAF